MVSPDFRSEVEIWPFSACAIHPAIIIGTVCSLWTRLRGRYYVPQNAFLSRKIWSKNSKHTSIVWCNIFRYLKPFRRDLRVWHTHRRTDRLAHSASLRCAASYSIPFHFIPFHRFISGNEAQDQQMSSYHHQTCECLSVQLNTHFVLFSEFSVNRMAYKLWYVNAK